MPARPEQPRRSLRERVGGARASPDPPPPRGSGAGAVPGFALPGGKHLGPPPPHPRGGGRALKCRASPPRARWRASWGKQPRPPPAPPASAGLGRKCLPGGAEASPAALGGPPAAASPGPARPGPSPLRRGAAGGSDDSAPAPSCPSARALEVEVCNRGASLKLTLFPVYRCSYLVRVLNGLDVYLGYHKPVRKCVLKPSFKRSSSLQSLLS